MRGWKNILHGLLTGLLVTQLGTAARAQDPADRGPTSGGASGPTMAQFAKLQNEVREQRQLIVEMLQVEQQRYDMLLKLLRGQGGAAPSDAPRLPLLDSGNDPSAATGTDGGGTRARGETNSADRGRRGENNPSDRGRRGEAGSADHGRRGATVAGRVGVTGGADAADVYVFIENVKAAPAKGKALEIKQEGKQFSPRLAVVQTGTSVTFPNFDSVYHNVFSTSPQNSFDLGTSRAGDTPRAVKLSKTGVVEVFCNMHQKMSANILVVPNPLYAKVRSDGTFRIDNVPLGTRRVVAWSPSSKRAEQQVDVTASGAEISFALDVDERKAHLNKLGQAYGSYRE